MLQLLAEITDDEMKALYKEWTL